MLSGAKAFEISDIQEDENKAAGWVEDWRGAP
jgi:hypothetical protein